MRIYTVTSAIITDGDWILLVKQKLPVAKRAHMQGRAFVDDYYWGFAGGKLEGDETIEQAMSREIKEETGLVINVQSSPILTCRYGDMDKNWRCHVTGFHLTHPYTTELSHTDPDGEISHAEWFRYTKALELIATIPWRCMSEPVLHYLEHRQPKHDWQYELLEGGDYKRV